MDSYIGTVATIEVTLFNDPGCPWGYSESPALAVLRWRYGSQLQWRLVTIGLAESTERYAQAGYTPTRMVAGQIMFRERYGMPFALAPRERVLATARACRAIVATRLLDPAREFAVLRALQLAWFNTTLLLDEDAGLTQALQAVAGLDAHGIVAALDDPRVGEAYEADKRETRDAEGGPTHFQGKARQTDGPVRYSAPSLVFTAREGAAAARRLEAGGFQTVEAYDVLIANLDSTLRREPPPESPLVALQRFPDGLVTQEVAAIMAVGNDPPDRAAAERALVALVGAGSARRTPLGGDALWQAA
ncbi:MAG TPA: DsbA family protein [Solirubrobacteraceae bacterium]|jgi:protein-disulfide isomerase-like protein with CxxC motif|nr:DsbA family protein [Solirubrobacteraceae bacterium]